MGGRPAEGLNAKNGRSLEPSSTAYSKSRRPLLHSERTAKRRRSNRAIRGIFLGNDKLTTRTPSMKWLVGLGSLALALGLASGQSAKSPKTDPEIKQAIIAESIARYNLDYARTAPARLTTERPIAVAFL